MISRETRAKDGAAVRVGCTAARTPRREIALSPAAAPASLAAYRPLMIPRQACGHLFGRARFALPTSALGL